MAEEVVEEIAEEVPEEYEDIQTLSWRDALRRSKLPIIVWMVLTTTFFACAFGGTGFLMFSVSGYAWILCFAFAVMVIPANLDNMSFPVLVWLPWGLFVGISSYMSDYTNLQRSAMLLCPIIVGMAASTAKINEEQLFNFGLLVRIFSSSLLFLGAFLTGLLLTGQLPVATGLAPQAITATLLATFFVTGYSYGRVKDLLWWGAIAMLPVLALTRMAIFATGLSLPLTFSPLQFRLRVSLTVVVALLGLALFYTPRVQEKMFMKGEGTLQDIGDEKNLATSGRRYIAEVLLLEIANKPWLGHGANASEELVLKLTNGQLTHPHNDWLRFLYDYGIVGTGLFLLTMLIQIRHLLKKARHSEGEIRTFFSATASSFLPFALIMFTDNIVLYAAFYGNLQFTILGLAYAAEKRGRLEKVSYDDDDFYEPPSTRTTRSIAYREEGAPFPAVTAETPPENETEHGDDH